MNRGLIEGLLNSRRGTSGFLLPRFMNRGLIEGHLPGQIYGALPHFPDS